MGTVPGIGEASCLRRVLTRPSAFPPIQLLTIDAERPFLGRSGGVSVARHSCEGRFCVTFASAETPTLRSPPIGVGSVSESENTIIERIRGGDVESYGLLVDRHKDQVYGVLRRLVGDAETAEDLAQTAFLKAFQGLATFRQQASFSTWVTQIAIHLARDDHRRRQRAQIVPLETADEGEGGSPSLAAASADPLETVIATDLQERLTRAISQLPSDYREVFVLRQIDERTYEEIAELTGVSVGALKVRNHRARKWLLDRLREEEQPSVLRLHRR